MTKLLAIAALLVVSVPAAAAAPPEGRGKPSEKAKAQNAAPADNPAKLCKAERQAMGAERFANEHGTNPNKKNAFGKCVSKKAKEKGDGEADDEAQDERRENAAARLCRAERESMGAERFADEHGTNHNKKNAFGKCVSKKVKQAR